MDLGWFWIPEPDKFDSFHMDGTPYSNDLCSISSRLEYIGLECHWIGESWYSTLVGVGTFEYQDVEPAEIFYTDFIYEIFCTDFTYVDSQSKVQFIVQFWSNPY